MINPNGEMKLRGPGNVTIFKKPKPAGVDEFVVRDMRTDYFQVDNVFVDVYARQCGIYAAGVYSALCRHANHSQTCFPSHRLIGEKMGISRSQVIRGIEILEYYNIIRVKRFFGERNEYELSKPICWKPADDERISKLLTARCKRKTRRSHWINCRNYGYL